MIASRRISHTCIRITYLTMAGLLIPNLEGQTRSNFKARMVEAKLNRFNLTLNYDFGFRDYYFIK
jgi:hypothetical protein